LTEWEIVRIGEDGQWRVMGSLARIDLAERWAQQVAESLARNDHGRVLRGVPCSGARAILVSHDLFVIDHAMSAPRVLAVPSMVPRQRIPDAVREMLRAYR
jgi:hypothetical protein